MIDNHFAESEQTWNKIATSFDITRKKPWSEVVSFIHSLSPSDVVADMGCGNGRHLVLCADQCKTVIGLDISRNLLRITQNKINREKHHTVVIQGNLVKIPIKDEIFHAVLYIAALHNIKEKQNRITSLQEVHRILKQGGQALVSVWSREQEQFRDSFGEISDNTAGQGDIYLNWTQHNLHVPRFYHLYSKEEFTEDLSASGFKIEKIIESKIRSKEYPDNYFAILRK